MKSPARTTIGEQTERDIGSGLLARSRARAALIPDLLVEAKRVANNVYAGWHGRRRRGVGENFWQFRPYRPGENMAAIDWRRSARDDHVYVRDREWQASHTVWLWVDESPSMLYQSRTAIVSKQSRALVLAFAMAELLSRSGERVGWLGIQPPIAHRHAAERLGSALMHAPPQTDFPDTISVRELSDVILISDFLEAADGLHDRLKQLANRQIRGHLVQMVDPAEDAFPYSGRVEFRDPETGTRMNAGSAQALRDDYRALFAAHTKSLSLLARRIGWSHTVHHTDHLASQALVALHMAMSHDPGFGTGGR
ncbi:MAG: DUF58 domain-containing protein [Nitratireductor sp.]|nr:DUF58 domain-containing protein [Nitratireductor sp.]MCC0022115.1 DUF58 domain-containing protein [Nitratireductor sp.]